MVVSGVLKSPWASNQTMAVDGPSPATQPRAAGPQFPESTRGNAPAILASRTAAATPRARSNAVPISARHVSLGASSTRT
jgi:hypothetical protein